MPEDKLFWLRHGACSTARLQHLLVVRRIVMVIEDRLCWIRSRIANGCPAACVVSYNEMTATHKVTIRVWQQQQRQLQVGVAASAAAGAAAAAASEATFLASALLDAIDCLVSNQEYSSSDKGHRHSSGVSVVQFFFKKKSFAKQQVRGQQQVRETAQAAQAQAQAEAVVKAQAVAQAQAAAACDARAAQEAAAAQAAMADQLRRRQEEKQRLAREDAHRIIQAAELQVQALVGRECHEAREAREAREVREAAPLKSCLKKQVPHQEAGQSNGGKGTDWSNRGARGFDLWAGATPGRPHIPARLSSTVQEQAGQAALERELAELVAARDALAAQLATTRDGANG
eukprot:TRINITY_DN8370_c0_g1_i1.p1 TRINITY_DN8370_c0_g1~~TRINITY_DN8370_c0_g1_i1.p1  ORF type:complete len:344 (+),score=80.25 TRINITY_DN8370_c0_g1_i1:73-1104(+)